MMRSRHSTVRHACSAASLGVVAALLAACSSSLSAPPASSTVSSPATTSRAPGATHPSTNRPALTPIKTRVSTCEQATNTVDAAVHHRGAAARHVTGLDTDPACTALVLTTDLTPVDDGAAALDICSAAAPAAYANGFTSLSVRAAGRGEDEQGNLSHSAGGIPCELTPSS